MSLFAKMFGGGKTKEKPPTPEEAIQKLREIEGMLGKKQDHLEKKIETEVATARKAGTKNKRVALEALRRKKRIEKQLQQIDGTLTTIEFQREALENASTNTEVLKIMGLAAKAMGAAHDNLDVEKVEDIMEEMQEQMELQREIDEAITRPMGFGDDIDEDELLAELEDMEDETFAKEFIGVPSVANLPSPSQEETLRPAAKEKKVEDDDDIKELAQWAS